MMKKTAITIAVAAAAAFTGPETHAGFLQEHDKDGDKLLTLEEFIGGREEKRTWLTKQFKKWDTNKDDRLSGAELRAGWAERKEKKEKEEGGE